MLLNARPTTQPRADACETTRNRLSRFLDNDLPGRDATRLVSHLHGCLSCRTELGALRGQRQRLSSLAPPPGASAARARVTARIQAAARVSGGPLSGARISKFRVAMAAGTAAALICATLMLAVSAGPRGKRSVPDRPASPPTSLTRRAVLPAPDEIAVLFQLHDAKCALRPVPVDAGQSAPTRDAGMSRNRPSDRANRRGRSLPPHAASAPGPIAGGPPPADLPEAL